MNMTVFFLYVEGIFNHKDLDKGSRVGMNDGDGEER